ncbi:MAG: calcium-translocating P-type ATPase, PMCA-type [Candidatus Aenigmarchaeota archaeon]|nr:calcium-translocating P-type ATPase, PMCA-type [Candidatus Aenigmarchaeota archaeon]
MRDEWERLKLTSAYKKLESGKDGITGDEAAMRLAKHGKNEITSTSHTSPLRIMISQFTSPLIVILIVAGLVSLGIALLPGSEHTIIDSALILLIVLAVGISGFFQDWKAEKAIDALKKMSSPTAKVIRDGTIISVKAVDLVPGDVVIIEPGDIVPADGKIIESMGMMIDESILTGESKTVRKAAGDVARMSTSLTSGRGKLLIFGTGLHTEVGRLAEKMEEIGETRTPFQNELSAFSKKIFWMVGIIAAVMMAVGYFKYGLYDAFLISISLAVAAIPEGLPAVVTLALALGAKSMASNNALIRKLAVAESVGSVNVICTDKTGTLTKNRMSVTKMYFDDVVFDSAALNDSDKGRMEKLMLCGTLCNDSRFMQGDGTERKMTGDQTEVAIAEFAINNGVDYDGLRGKYKRINEISFTSKRKMMSVLCRHQNENVVFTKGAPEVVLNHCTRMLFGGKIVKLDRKRKEKILKQNTQFASHALRVLAFSYKKASGSISEEEMESDMIFIGLEGMLDPPRDEVKDALADCATAGIRVVMITGDNIETAKAIANEIGLSSTSAISGDDIGKMSDADLRKVLDAGANIFARTSPFDKLRILEILQKDNRVIMTGDGVNDVLALKKADVGIAMGERGTEVAKEASDIILLDDNFTSIRNAVREGRRIFDNIRKFVNYLLSCNLAEVFVIFLGTMIFSMNDPIMLPVHILWINLLTDGMPALALGVDPALPNTMKRKPREIGDSILDRKTFYNVMAMGLNMGIILLLVFTMTLSSGLETARTTLFMGFVLYEFMRIAVIRHQEELGIFDNKMILVTLMVSLILQLTVIYSPLNAYFSLVPLGLYEWSVLLAFAAVGWMTSIGLSRIVTRKTK